MEHKIFFVVSKPLKGERPPPSLEQLRGSAEKLRRAMERGHLLGAYSFVSGGAVYFFRSPSRELLEAQLRRHPLGRCSEITIHEVRDTLEDLAERSATSEAEAP